jgi:hypothetical protein
VGCFRRLLHARALWKPCQEQPIEGMVGICVEMRRIFVPEVPELRRHIRRQRPEGLMSINDLQHLATSYIGTAPASRTTPFS